MAYTVKKLAKISGVSIRTLHFYDELKLLLPAYVGDNGYRYYEEAQLLKLQQILFYRELGFPLKEIQKLLKKSDFNTMETLKSQKQQLKQRLDHTEKLIKTIDKTIAYLRGKTKMRHEELYYGFDSEKQKKYEQYLVETGRVTAEEMKKSRSQWKMTDEDSKKWKEESDRLFQTLAEAIEKGLSPGSAEVQKLIQKQYEWICRFWTPDKEKFIGMTELYHEHPDFRKFFEAYHPKMLAFVSEAMKIYAERQL